MGETMTDMTPRQQQRHHEFHEQGPGPLDAAHACALVVLAMVGLVTVAGVLAWMFWGYAVYLIAAAAVYGAGRWVYRRLFTRISPQTSAP